MGRLFAPLDDVLIERVFQPLSDLCQQRLGLGLAGAACCCVDLASVGWILARAGGLSAAVTAWDAGGSFVGVIVLLVGLLALISLRTLLRRIGGKPAANPLRLSMQPHRAIVLLMLASRLVQFATSPVGGADFGDAADIAMVLFSAAALYLGACIERPPVRRVWAVMAGAGAG